VIRRIVTLLLVAAASTAAQTAPPQPSILRPADAAIVGGALAASALLIPFDSKIVEWKGIPVFRNSPGVHRTLSATAFLGGPGTLIASGAFFAAGRIAKNRNLATDGEAALEAAALGGAVTFIVKGIAGRARPLVDSTRADDFALLRGFGRDDLYRSFPSGHTTVAFAFATALATRLSHRGDASAAWAGPAAFTLATFTGVSRIFYHDHWFTDCLTGAAIGTVSGLAVARWHERHP
jgi:membrane-associated phospholipid phosphatase